jgi:PAS domain-containing protein
MNPEYTDKIEFIDAMPGFISIIDLDLRYLTVNKKLAELMKLDTESFKGMTVGSKCYEQRKQLQTLVDAQVGTEINWEYFHNETCLLVSSKREQYFIINQAIDISDRKKQEENLRASNERNRILLKSIPDAIKSGAGRRSTDELEFLVNSLVESPIVDQRQSSNEALIKLEVQVRENSSRMQQIEKMLFLDESALLGRVRELEVHQRNDFENWKGFEDNKDKIENLSRIATMITSIPGGLRTWLITLIILQMTGIFVIDMGIRFFNWETLIPIERKNQ